MGWAGWPIEVATKPQLPGRKQLAAALPVSNVCKHCKRRKKLLASALTRLGKGGRSHANIIGIAAGLKPFHDFSQKHLCV